jgi:hypothetical protein
MPTYFIRDGEGNLEQVEAEVLPGGAVLPQSVPSDITGTPLFSQSNPGYVDPLAPAPDTRLASADQITIVDSGTSSTAGQNGQSFITGSPTPASSATIPINGQAAVRVQVSGTWSGTLAFEVSADGGLSYVPVHGHVVGTIKLATSITANGQFLIPVAGATNFRVRATSFSSGIASIQLSSTVGAAVHINASPLQAAEIEGIKWTYWASLAFAPASAATDAVVIQGSATKTVRIRRIILAAIAGSAADVLVSLIRRSAGDTGGTSSGVTLGRSDINDPTATASVSTYTANPTVGTAVATLFELPMGMNTSSSGSQDRLNLTFGEEGGKSLVLRGTSDYLAINLNGASPTGLYGTIEFTEEL